MTEYICLINNFNYSQYLPACIDSALSQSLPFNKIIIVDDGSSDNSREVIESYQNHNPKIISIFQENQGQMSTFNAAEQLISENSQVFLLDADDVYPSDYLELMVEKFPTKIPNFTFCEPRYTKSSEISSIDSANAGNQKSQIYPKTSAIVRSRRCWIGGPTSCISMSGSLFKTIFPYTYASEFRIRADDGIIFSASLAGSEKVYIPSLSIIYRVHEKNSFYNTSATKSASIKHDAAILKLVSYFCTKLNINPNPSITEFFSEMRHLSQEQKVSLNLPSRYRVVNRLIRKRFFPNKPPKNL
jgi:glycosyltransferase involved in cell wall biosynthesis